MSFALGEMGMRDDDFWSLTPYELHQRLRGWKRRQEANRLKLLYEAWHAAAFSRARRLPSLRNILRRQKTRKLTAAEARDHRKHFEGMAQRAGVKIYGED